LNFLGGRARYLACSRFSASTELFLEENGHGFWILGVSLVSEEDEELLSVEWSDKEFFSQILSTTAASLPFLLQFLLFALLSFPPPLAIGVSVLFV
jgi:hypothetical protein